MTVIVTDGHTMAGDGQGMMGWAIYETDGVKVHRLEDGTLYGSTGNSEECLAFGEWIVDTTKAKPTLTEGFSSLVVTPDGMILCYQAALVPIPLTAPQAIGCGKDFAFAAMDLGAPPKRAVEIACQRSGGCGGLITVVVRGDLS